MRMNNSALMFPVLAVLIVAAFGGGLGFIFIVINEEVGKWAVIVLGSALVVGVPVAAALGQRMVEKN
jgi:hypothetical protein